MAPDLPGHGAQAMRTPPNFAAAVEHVARSLTPEATVCGYSMGGRIALGVALARADAVARLILVSTTAGLSDPTERTSRTTADAALADRFAAMTIDEVVAFWAAQPIFAGQRPDVRAAANVDRRRNDPTALAAALRVLGTGVMEPLWDRLAELSMPVDVVVGETDTKFREIGERLAALSPSARLHVVPAAGHALPFEAPGALARIIEGDSA